MKKDINSFVAHQIEGQRLSFINWVTAYLDTANASLERKNVIDYFSFEGLEYHNPHNMQTGDHAWKYKIEVSGKSAAEDTVPIEFSLLLSEGYLREDPLIFASTQWINDAVKARLADCYLNVAGPTLKTLRTVICAHIMHLQHIKAQIQFIEKSQTHTQKISVPEFQIERFEYIYTTPF